MKLEELEALARDAAAEADEDWFCPELIESDAPILSSRKARRLIAAMHPARVLRMLEVVKAAQRVTEQRMDKVWSEFDADVTALRCALAALDAIGAAPEGGK